MFYHPCHAVMDGWQNTSKKTELESYSVKELHMRFTLLWSNTQCRMGSPPWDLALGAQLRVPSQQRLLSLLTHSDAAADFPVRFGDDSAVTQMCFFTVVWKSDSKQNSQAPDDTFLRREFSHQSIDWCSLKRHILNSRSPGNSSPSLAEIQNKRVFLGITCCWNILWG